MDLRRTLLATTGAVATAAGTHQVATGVAGVRGSSTTHAPDPSVDSELRFFAAWYAAGGLLMLREATRPQPDTTTTRLVAGGWALAAIGRVLSMRAVGRPHPVFVGLAAAEVAVAATLALTDPQRRQRHRRDR